MIEGDPQGEYIGPGTRVDAVGIEDGKEGEEGDVRAEEEGEGQGGVRK